MFGFRIMGSQPPGTFWICTDGILDQLQNRSLWLDCRVGLRLTDSGDLFGNIGDRGEVREQREIDC